MGSKTLGVWMGCCLIWALIPDGTRHGAGDNFGAGVIWAVIGLVLHAAITLITALFGRRE